MSNRRRLVCFALAALGSMLGAQQGLDGEWVGGFQDGRTFVYLRPRFATEGGVLSGTTSIPFQFRPNVPLTELSFDGRRLSFALQERGVTRRILAEVDGEVTSGTVDVDGRSSPFHLVRVVPVSPERLAAQSGLYQLEDGSVVGATGGGELGFGSFLDFRTGMQRSLFPRSESELVIGPGWYVPYPPERIVSFREGEGGRELSLREGAREERGTRLDFHEEEVRFENGDVTLAGVLVLPPGPGPFPAVVFIHGSGPGTRGGLLPYYFAHLGFATLSYDKRGVGGSTGTYEPRVDAEELENLAWDALAGVELLKGRPEIDARRIGLWGISQAGWIIAIAAASSTDIAYSVVVSGAAVSLGEEGAFSLLTGDDGGGPHLPDAEIAARMREVRPSGFDPRPLLGEITSPSLWIFGDRDPSVPVELSIGVLEQVRRERGWDVTVRVFPRANHILLECETGDRSEFPLLQRYVPGYFELMTDWMRERTRQPSGPAPR